MGRFGSTRPRVEHVDCHDEEQNAAKNAETGQADSEKMEDVLAQNCTRNKHNDRRNDRNIGDLLPLVGVVRGKGKKERGNPDRIDHNKQGDKHFRQFSRIDHRTSVPTISTLLWSLFPVGESIGIISK